MKPLGKQLPIWAVSAASAPTATPPDWHQLPLKHVIESQQFTPESLKKVFETAQEMESVRPGSDASRMLNGQIMSTLFYEPSTSKHCTPAAAALNRFVCSMSRRQLRRDSAVV